MHSYIQVSDMNCSIKSINFSQMINGLVAYVELEHEIVKWTRSIANSLALICNTVHKRCRVGLHSRKADILDLF